MLWVSFWCSVSFVWSNFFKAGLLAMNFLSFLNISPSLLMDIFTGFRILGWHFFSFSTYKIGGRLLLASLVLVCLVKWEIHSYLNCCFLTSITSFVFGFFQKVLFLLLLLLLFSGVAVSITQGCEFLWVYLCEICWTSWKCGFLSFAKCEDCTAIFFFFQITFFSDLYLYSRISVTRLLHFLLWFYGFLSFFLSFLSLFHFFSFCF